MSLARLVSPYGGKEERQLDVDGREGKESRDQDLGRGRSVPWQRGNLTWQLVGPTGSLEFALGVFALHASIYGQREGNQAPDDDDQKDGAEGKGLRGPAVEEEYISPGRKKNFSKCSIF